ncbi:MAG: HAD-IA family hydrolase [Gammaproteobacteria bacterium]
MRAVNERGAPRAVLFDLDGTLLDTARDLAAALNRVRMAEGLEALPFTAVRPFVSHGSFALTRLGFALADHDAAFEPLRLRLLDEYRACIADETTPFDGVPDVLNWLAARALRWGIVTNKPGWLTTPLMTHITLPHPPGCVISGDTLPTRKPDPAPLLHAAELLGVAPHECVYVGDAERDVAAGRRAAMHTLVARYGYLGPEDTPAAWGADGEIDSPRALCTWLENRWPELAAHVP